MKFLRIFSGRTPEKPDVATDQANAPPDIPSVIEDDKRRLILRLRNASLIVDLNAALRDSPEYVICEALTRESIPVVCGGHMPYAMVTDVDLKEPNAFEECMAEVKEYRTLYPESKVMLLVPDPKRLDRFDGVKKAKKSGMIDQFLFYSSDYLLDYNSCQFPAAYFVALLDTI